MLHEAEMVGIDRQAPTNQAWLFGHEFDVLLVTRPARFRMAKPAFVNAVGQAHSWDRLPPER